MQPREQITVIRDTTAIQIPDGNRVPLPAGTDVVITQALGGSYTVMTQFGQMLRVDPKDSDALGKDVPDEVATETPEGETLDEKIWSRMKQCYDPEIPVNIVDLGLVYDCQIAEQEHGGHRVQVKMTLTAPGCGMGDVLAQDVKTRIEDLPEIEEADIELVFDPAWNMEMMTEAARLQLGLL